MIGDSTMSLLSFWHRAWARRGSLELSPQILDLLAFRHAEDVARLFALSEKDGTAREDPGRLVIDASLSVKDLARPGPRTRDAARTREAMTRALRVILSGELLREQLRADLRASLEKGGRPIPALEWVEELGILRRDREHECSLGAMSPDPEEVLRAVRGPMPAIRVAVLMLLLLALLLHLAGS